MSEHLDSNRSAKIKAAIPKIHNTNYMDDFGGLSPLAFPLEKLADIIVLSTGSISLIPASSLAAVPLFILISVCFDEICGKYLNKSCLGTQATQISPQSTSFPHSPVYYVFVYIALSLKGTNHFFPSIESRRHVAS